MGVITSRRMSVTLINPLDMARPKGFSHGAIGRGRVLAIAGQIGWDENSRLVGLDFISQFGQALANVARVLFAAGGQPSDLISLRIYVIDKQDYLADLSAVGAAYRKQLGRHFPAMALVEVKGLLEEGARVEIEALAMLEGEAGT